MSKVYNTQTNKSTSFFEKNHNNFLSDFIYSDGVCFGKKESKNQEPDLNESFQALLTW